MKKLILVLFMVAALAGAAFAQAAKPRVAHDIDLRKSLPRFLTAQGFLDPKFAEATAKPSPYLTDFYGVQALRDLTKESLKRDFVPKFAEVVAEDGNTLELKFKNGYMGKFTCTRR